MKYVEKARRAFVVMLMLVFQNDVNDGRYVYLCGGNIIYKGHPLITYSSMASPDVANLIIIEAGLGLVSSRILSEKVLKSASWQCGARSPGICKVGSPGGLIFTGHPRGLPARGSQERRGRKEI